MRIEPSAIKNIATKSFLRFSFFFHFSELKLGQIRSNLFTLHLASNDFKNGLCFIAFPKPPAKLLENKLDLFSLKFSNSKQCFPSLIYAFFCLVRCYESPLAVQQATWNGSVPEVRYRWSRSLISYVCNETVTIHDDWWYNTRTFSVSIVLILLALPLQFNYALIR